AYLIDAAIVGLGRWGKNFVEAVQGKSDRLRFVRGVDAAPDKLRDFAAKHAFRLCTDLAEVLADPAIKAVVLATPHSLHRPMVEASARAGKQIFCEKPFALNFADAAAMVEACNRAGVVLGVGHNRRFWPSMVALKRAVDAGELGQLLHIEGHFSNEHSNNTAGTWRDSPEESPGGGITGAGLHVLDAFLNIIGPVKKVRGQLIVRKAPPVARDVASVMLEFANGVSGAFTTVRATPLYWRVHVFGDRGSAESISENELQIHRSNAQPERIALAPVDSLRIELEAFADAVDGRAAYPVSAAEVLRTVATFEAVIKALETGATIEMTG
ncbi:MAG: Gfo/Idh/MocA family oxidoreductase, partial [Proteobacteria bacterium]|nr:Gfo/Idh/MocA family oxidoreductase [Pseudomonadota bacterium]